MAYELVPFVGSHYFITHEWQANGQRKSLKNKNTWKGAFQLCRARSRWHFLYYFV
jgi:hypothetical protein